MKTILFFIVLFCSILTIDSKAQTAPVTYAGIITNATTGTGATVVPITVNNFVSIGAFTLTLRYRLSYATYVSFAPHPSFPGMSVTHTVSGLFGKIVINWPQTPAGITLPDETVLLNLNFTYITNNCALVWLFSGTGNICLYKKYTNGSYVTLSDYPKQSYYINGGFANRGAPLAYLPTINNPSPGSLAVPITVQNFTLIGNNNLAVEYNGDVLTFQNVTRNPLLTGSFDFGSQLGPNGKMMVTISWVSGTSASLANGSIAYTINFTYSNSNGSCSYLDFLNDGSSCEYANTFAEPFFDLPTSSYYFNGKIYTAYSPKVWLPVITEAAPSGSISLPIRVNDFNNVRSFTLSFEYDGTVMIYSGFTPDAAFGNELTATDSPSGSKRKVVLSWTGTVNKTLPAGSLIADVNFNYISGTSPLTWMVTDGTSCRFNDAIGNAYFDWPKSTYYQDGIVASHVAPVTVGSQLTAVAGQPVAVPVTVYDFSNIGLFGLTLDYDPAVLSYQGVTLVPSIGGTFSADTAGKGRIMMDWSGPAASLADSTTLINLNFIYNGGATNLNWIDNGDSCKYKETPSGPSLYDLPRSKFYVNGYVGPNPLIANFIANTTTGDLNTTFTLTDQSTGGPASWYWTISPSTYYFVNGTSASSQNPQIKFTANGGYTVNLYITRGTTNAIRIRNNYLHIGTPGLWTGITSSDWNVASNWHNHAVPTSAVDVLIPAAAPNWPVLSGSLSIGGTQCANVTIQGTAQLTVSGNLSINNGSALTFTGPGSLNLGGNWTNNGSFICSNSTVNFTGTADASVNDNGSTQDFYTIIVSKTGGIVTFLGDVNILGIE